MTLGIVKKNEQELSDWLANEWGFLAGLAKFDDEPVTLERYQMAFLRNRSRFRWVTKSRQVGFSFVFALEALARCHLRDKHTAVFVSYNLEDAKEKVLIARQIHEELPLAYQKRLVVDSKTELAFESNSSNKRLSRIISAPSKAPRGKKGDVYLDELAHYVLDREVYTGSTALILRSHGQLSSCSTPLGRRGIFWEISTEELRKYPHHTRDEVPWWRCRFFCLDIDRAMREAPHMPTEERVAAFGTQAIVQQLDSLPLEDFQQEFECSFVDESYSYYPYELILPCTSEDLVPAGDFTDLPEPEGRIVAGFDVGRTRDRSELAVFEDTGGHFVCRLLRRYDQVPFAEQEADLRRFLDRVPVARLSIDQSGIGMHLAENLARDYAQVVGDTFTNDNKERWATDLKILFQRKDIALPRDRELVGQIHSIKRRVLPSGKVGFDAERSTRGGHADRFWAIALACQKERGTAPQARAHVGVRVLG
ncbi:terminase large subunit domain-containing protein [Haliangium ochraceum]|uniref:terminase large subunit domain-containing protein n=1 Tax=Haliangium ochraceum TaxID=80816 RepID=UPI00019BA437|nr:terminase family protein [Haliangium ochraceum]